MLKKYSADLHIHTCLSPCASNEMIPPNILNMSKLLGTNIIGICDHNSAKNVKSVIEASKDYNNILVLPGMEIQSIEEVHMLCFYDEFSKLEAWQDYIYSHLPKRKNDSGIFGSQLIVDKRGSVLQTEDRLLLTSTDLTVEQISKKVRKLGGLLIPAHIDKKSFSLLSQLGFIPENIEIDALEISRNITKGNCRKTFPFVANYNLITSSDAHRLKEMVFQKTFFYIKSLTFNEIRLALRGQEGRRIVINN